MSFDRVFLPHQLAWFATPWQFHFKVVLRQLEKLVEARYLWWRDTLWWMWQMNLICDGEIRYDGCDRWTFARRRVESLLRENDSRNIWETRSAISPHKKGKAYTFKLSYNLHTVRRELLIQIWFTLIKTGNFTIFVSCSICNDQFLLYSHICCSLTVLGFMGLTVPILT